MSGKLLSRVVITVSALILGACDNEVAPVAANSHAPASITLAASSANVLTSAGDTRTITAVVRDSAGREVPASNMQWSSSAAGVATFVIDAEGQITVTAVGDGTTIISARSGDVQASTGIIVRRVLSSVSLTVAARSLDFGATTQLTATAYDARDNAIPNVQGFIFKSDNPATLFVQPNGMVTALLKFGQSQSGVLMATLTRDGVTRSDTVAMDIVPPASVDIAALLLTEFVVPLNPPTGGSGLAHLFRRSDRLDVRLYWASLTSRVTSAEIHGAAAFDQTAEILVQLGPLPTPDSLGVLITSIRAADIRS
ncbi:MAG: hypothetical protein ABI852_00055, partial [Gemmatimonadaceae bacterium]